MAQTLPTYSSTVYRNRSIFFYIALGASSAHIQFCFPQTLRTTVQTSLRATVANQHHRWARAAIEEPDVAKLCTKTLDLSSVQLFVLLRYSIQIVPLKSPINRNYRSPQENTKLTTITNIPFTVWGPTGR